MGKYLNNPVTLVTLIIGFVVLCGIIAVIVITGHDPSAYVGTIGTLVVAITGLAALGGQQQKVLSNTNGTLSAKDAKINELNAHNTALIGALVAQQAAPTPEHAANAVETVNNITATASGSPDVPNLPTIPPLPTIPAAPTTTPAS